MAYFRALNTVRQRLNFASNQTNHLQPETSHPMRTVAGVGAALLVGASASLGSYYGYLVGSHQSVLVGVVFAGAALGGELLKPFCVDAAIEAITRLKIVRAVACALLATVCITYSLAAELSLAAGSRGDLAASRAAIVDNAKDMAAEKHRAEAELAALPVTAPAAKIQAELDGLMLTPNLNACVKIDGDVTRKLCPKIATLKADKAVAQRRSELEGIIKTSIQSAPAVQVHDADPLAAVVSTYGRAAGWSVTSEDVAPWLALVPVLFLEVGSALALVVIRAGGTPSPAPAAGPVQATEAATAAVPTELVQTPAKRRDRKPPSGPAVLGDMTDRIRKAGGAIEGTQRSIAKALGTSKSSVQRTLQVLIASGAVLASVGPQGTRLVLA